MELLLDTANLEKLSEALEFYPVSGLTTNPSLFKKEGKPDFFAHARELRNLLGNKRTFHVQVVSPDCEGILREADAIRRNIDEFVYIKTPVSREGLKAIGIMTKEGFNVTATAIYTTMQGQLAAMAGAKYLALYYNRMLNLDIDADKVFFQTAQAISNSKLECKIVGASFKNVAQLTNAVSAGAQAITVPPELLDAALSNPSINVAVENFRRDWASVYGDKTPADF